MRVVPVTRSAIRAYSSFCKSLYRDTPHFRDIMGPTIARVLSGKAQICRNMVVEPLMVMKGDSIAAAGILSIVNRMPDTVQIACFQARENQQQAVDMLVQQARDSVSDYTFILLRIARP